MHIHPPSKYMYKTCDMHVHPPSKYIFDTFLLIKCIKHAHKFKIKIPRPEIWKGEEGGTIVAVLVVTLLPILLLKHIGLLILQ